MRRSSVLLTILFLAIGFATISTTLLIRGNTSIGINEDDFNVYFSDAKVNGTQDLSIVESYKKLSFSATLKSKDQTYVVDYNVTNGSKNYDAKLEMNCTNGNEYLSVTNVFDTTNNLLASETRSGKLTITLEKQYTGAELDNPISCTITATGVERTELDTGVPAEPLPCKWVYEDSDSSGSITIGDEYTYCTESFNVISKTDDAVTMLAKYNLGTNYRQSTTNNGVSFSTSHGWESKPGPKEIDIFRWSTNPKNYINNYVSYLQTETGDTSITGNLITLMELGALGCTISDDYGGSGLTCENSAYADWLVNGQYWWMRSASSDLSTWVWYVNYNGVLFDNGYSSTYGVRPVITISKDRLN